MGRKSTSGRRGPSLLSCNICGEECSDPSALSRHMGNHGGKDRSTCDICSKEFRNKVRIWRELQVWKLWKKCSFLKVSLRTHMKLVHKLGRQYTCAYCGKIFYSSQWVYLNDLEWYSKVTPCIILNLYTLYYSKFYLIAWTPTPTKILILSFCKNIFPLNKISVYCYGTQEKF